MSGNDGVISFDLVHGKGTPLDVSRFFRVSEAHALRTQKPILETIRKGEGKVHDLSVEKTITLKRFRTLATLDIIARDLVEVPAIQRKLTGLPERSRILDLVAPLDMPYGALDVRPMRKHISSKKYPDIYKRSLPYSLWAKRGVKTSRSYITSHKKELLSLGVTLIVVSVPLLLYVRFSLENGYKKLMSIPTVASFSEARGIVESARSDFERANFVFFPFTHIPVSQIALADTALQSGLLVSRALDTLFETLPTGTGTTLGLAKSENLAPEYRKEAKDILPLAKLGIDAPTDWAREHIGDFRSMASDLAEASKLLQNTSTGSDLGNKMHLVGDILAKSVGALSWALENESDVLSFLGHEEPVRYIVFNQNRDEIRANGGFPGSVVSLTLYKGNILDMRKDDVYYYDWNLYPYKEPPPPGLALLTDTYGLRDVNYYPDFRQTLEKANSFIERSGDSTVTTGIAIHQGMIEDILASVGPVTVSGVTIPFDATNFSLLMSTLVENKYAREHSPKDILFHFAEELLQKVHEKRAYMAVFETLEKYWKDGEIEVASRDARMEAFLSQYKRKLPWETDTKNWVYPVFTSVSGNKSDRYITRKYEGKTSKLQNCTYENIVTLSNTHIYTPKDLDTVRGYFDTLGIADKKEREKLEFIEGNGKNRAFVRLYVPKSSTLAFTGADISETSNENAKVFSFLLETPVGGTTSKTLRYITDIPNCENENANLSWWRQPGLHAVEIK